MVDSSKRVKIKRLIGCLKKGMNIHLEWARFQERKKRYSLPRTPHVGSPSHHRRWVEIYKETIELLEEME